MSSVFSASLVARVPAASGPPALVEVDRLVFDQLSYVDELNRPGSATVGCPVRSMSSAVKERLVDLAAFPSEVWVYRDSTVAWAGEVQTIGMRAQAVQLGCAGLLGYTHRMGVTADLTWTNTEQFAIARALVNHWQSLPYGHYGINTSSAVVSGVVRDRTYLQSELHNVGKRLEELGAVDNGFDLHVDAATRELVLSYPRRGLDLTDSVFLDARNIDSASVAMSVGPDDLVSDVSATATSQSTEGAGSKLYGERANTALRAAYGRSWGSATFDGVTQEATLIGHQDAYLAARTGQLFQPGVTVVPRAGARPGDFGPGDVVSYSYDAGLGLQSGEFRLAKVTVDVSDDGRQRLGAEFI